MSAEVRQVSSEQLEEVADSTFAMIEALNEMSFRAQKAEARVAVLESLIIDVARAAAAEAKGDVRALAKALGRVTRVIKEGV